jgi:hypothetical protein
MKKRRKREAGRGEPKTTAYSRPKIETKIIVPGTARRCFRFPRIPLSILILRAFL